MRHKGVSKKPKKLQKRACPMLPHLVTLLPNVVTLKIEGEEKYIVTKKHLVDPETGEMIYALVPVRQKYATGGFLMAMQEGLIWLAKQDLTGEQMRVLMFVMGKLDFENWLRLSQAEIAKELGMKRPHVSRAINKLVEKGIIHKGPKVGTSWTYRLDTNFGWKGRMKNKKAAENAIKKAREKGWEIIKGSDT
jgi:DNA-binding transcriptional regulator YhcF (GntR family)